MLLLLRNSRVWGGGGGGGEKRGSGGGGEGGAHTLIGHRSVIYARLHFYPVLGSHRRTV